MSIYSSLTTKPLLCFTCEQLTNSLKNNGFVKLQSRIISLIVFSGWIHTPILCSNISSCSEIDDNVFVS